MNPAEFSIKNRLISFIVIVGALIAGWLAYQTMPRFEDPEFTIRQAQIVTRYPGATPLEVANEVTEALESEIQQMQEVDTITSVSSAGLSRITVEIKYEFSPTKDALDLIWTKLRNRINDAQLSLPPGAGPSIVYDDFGDVYGLYYVLTGEGFTPRELLTYAKGLRTDLLAVPDVGAVVIEGEQSEAIYIEIARDRASALGVSVEQVYADLAQQNAVAAAGDVTVGDRRITIHPTGAISSVEAIGNLIVSTPESGTIVYLNDIATVRRAYQDPQRFIMRYNGEPAIGLGVSNVTGANVVAMGAAIDVALEEGLSRRPLGIEVHEYYHQGKVVEVSIQDFAINVLMALIIVLVTLFVFMGLRSALVIGGVLIITIAATLATMQQLGIPMHRISLGALIIALGMLVDNAIVVTEGILVGVQRGLKKLDIAKTVVTRTVWPLLGGTVVGIIAFAPIGFAPGSTAEYTGDLFWVIMISLLYSWVFAITAVPLFADLLFKESQSAQDSPAPAEGPLTRRYKAFMGWMLGFRWGVVGVAVALFASSVWGFQFVKSGFFPASTTPQIVVDLWLPEGTDIERTQADMLSLEGRLQALEGVNTVHALIGGGTLRYMLVYSFESGNPAYGQFLLKVDEFEQIAGLIPVIQQMIDAAYPDIQAKVWQFQLGPGGGSKIEAEFYGPDPVVLRQLANEAMAIMANTQGAISVKNNWRQQVSVIEPQYAETRGRRLGVSREDLSNALQTNFSGRNVGVYREGDDLIPIIARAPENERLSPESIGSIQIASPVSGASVPLIEVVNGIDVVWRDAMLRREDRVWRIKVQADPVPGLLPSELFNQIRPQIEAMQLPDGYGLEWGGEFGDSSEANQNLASTIPLGLLAMVLVVVLLFNALRQPLVIWLVVPLSLIGVVSWGCCLCQAC